MSLELIRNRIAVAGSTPEMKRLVLGGEITVPSPNKGLWKNAPALGYYADPNLAYGVFDDFITAPCDDTTFLPTGYNVAGDSGVAFGPVANKPGGVFRLTTGSTANDMAIALMTSKGSSNGVGEPFQIAENSGKKLWYGTRVSFPQITNNAIAFGFTNEAATGDILTDTTGVIAANLDFIGFNILTAAALLASFKTGTETVVASAVTTVVASTFYTLGLYFDGVKTVSAYINDVLIGTMDVSAAAFPENCVAPFFAVKGINAAKSLDVDWVKVIQYR